MDTRSDRPIATTENQRHSGSVTPPWRQFLPAEWQDAVEAPLHFKHYREYEMNAQRTVGYDADDQPCFTAHRVIVTRPVSDDDEEYYSVVSYGEEMAAWRLRDDRWLIYRAFTSGNCAPVRNFYTLGSEMPR